MKYLYPLALILSMPLTIYADVTVEGERKVAPGDMAVLTVTSEDASKFYWTPVGHTRAVFDPVLTGAHIAFSTGTPGVYPFVVSVKEGTIAAPATVLIEVGDGVIPIPPGPEPNPPEPGPEPEPTPPDLSARVKTLASTIDTPTVTREATSLSSSYAQLGSQVAAGGLSFADLLPRLKEVHSTAVGPSALQWRPVFVLLAEELGKVQNDTKAVADVLAQFSDGLKR